MAFAQFGGTAYYDQPGVYSVFPPDERVLTSLSMWEMSQGEHQAVHGHQDAPQARTGQTFAGAEDQDLAPLSANRLRPDAGNVEPLDKELGKIAKKLKETDDGIPHTLMSEEMPTPRPAFVLLRGDFLKKGEKVEPGVPAIFPALPKARPTTASAWPSGSSAPIILSLPAWPSIASGHSFRHRPGQEDRRFRHCKENSRRIPSCSIGSRWSSWATARPIRARQGAVGDGRWNVKASSRRWCCPRPINNRPS